MRDANGEPVPLSHPTRKTPPAPNARTTDKGLDARSPASGTATFLTQLQVPSVCASILINLKAAEDRRSPRPAGSRKRLDRLEASWRRLRQGYGVPGCVRCCAALAADHEPDGKWVFEAGGRTRGSPRRSP